MEAIHNINLTSLLDTLISLAAAFVLGGLIGFERQYRQRTAGLRTQCGGHTLLHRLVNAIDRKPLDVEMVEVTKHRLCDRRVYAADDGTGLACRWQGKVERV